MLIQKGKCAFTGCKEQSEYVLRREVVRSFLSGEMEQTGYTPISLFCQEHAEIKFEELKESKMAETDIEQNKTVYLDIIKIDDLNKNKDQKQEKKEG